MVRLLAAPPRIPAQVSVDPETASHPHPGCLVAERQRRLGADRALLAQQLGSKEESLVVGSPYCCDTCLSVVTVGWPAVRWLARAG